MNYIRPYQHRCIDAEVQRVIRCWSARFVLALAVLLTAFPAYPQSNDNESTNYLPDRFEYFEGHAYIGSDRVVWQNHRLVVVKRVANMKGSFSEKARHLDPPREAWERYWKRADSLGIWQWKSDYNNPERDWPDSESWSLGLRFGEKHLESKGYNAVPDDYSAFRDAVHKLIEETR